MNIEQTPRTITTNADNWTGEEITAKVTKRGFFRVNDLRFRAIESKETHEGLVAGTFRKIEIWLLTPNAKHIRAAQVVAVGYRFEDDDTWLVSEHGGEMSAEHKDPIAAAIKIIANTF